MNVKCPIENCGKQFVNNAGLSSHLRSAHKAEPSKADYVAAAVIPAPSENAESLDSRYAKLWAKGVYRCLECQDHSHRRVTFPDAKSLGRHRRFAHGVVGKNAAKNAASVQRTKESLAAPGRIPLDQPGIFSCPHCTRTFSTTRGLNVHKAVHKGESSAIVHIPPKEFMNGHERKVEQSGGNHTHQPDPSAQTLAVAYLAGQFKSLIATTADEYDVAPRNLAKGCLLYLSALYTQGR